MYSKYIHCEYVFVYSLSVHLLQIHISYWFIRRIKLVLNSCGGYDH